MYFVLLGWAELSPSFPSPSEKRTHLFSVSFLLDNRFKRQHPDWPLFGLCLLIKLTLFMASLHVPAVCEHNATQLIDSMSPLVHTQQDFTSADTQWPF
jgi:hypothetical protein